MKHFILLLLATSFILSGDEIERMESIVKDITKLRVQYENCQEQLKAKVLAQEPQDLELELLELEKSNKKKEEILKSKDLEILNMKKRYEVLLHQQENKIITLKNQIKNKKNTISEKKETLFVTHCEEPNPFPKLMMREKSEAKTQRHSEQKKKAHTYRLKIQSDIYGSIDGKVIDSWEEQRSFTSDKKYENWIKITGYFVDKKWRKAKEDLWVLEENVSQRD